MTTGPFEQYRYRLSPSEKPAGSAAVHLLQPWRVVPCPEVVEPGLFVALLPAEAIALAEAVAGLGRAIRRGAERVVLVRDRLPFSSVSSVAEPR